MKRAPIYLASLVALPLYGQNALRDDPAAPPITVYTQFEKPPSAISLAEMKDELTAIMGPIGLTFDWRALDGSRAAEVSVELVVVSFKGKCQEEDGVLPTRGEHGALGWTHMSDGDVLPFSDVDCDKIRRFISPQVTSLEPAAQERVFGRAMGRVLAHELYHVFTNSTRHAAWGVAKAFYTAQELVSDNFVFQQKESKTLRDGKFKTLLRNRRPSANGFSGAGH